MNESQQVVAGVAGVQGHLISVKTVLLWHIIQTGIWRQVSKYLCETCVLTECEMQN